MISLLTSPGLRAPIGLGVLCLLVLLLDSLAGTAAAQTPARVSTATLVVQVLDTAEAPVPMADVILRGARMQGTSGATGRVTLRNITPGIDTLLVRRLGYDPLIVAVRFVAGDTLSVEAVLDARLVALEEIEVVGRPGLSTFERRMKNAIFSPPNSFYTPEALDTFPPRSTFGRFSSGRESPIDPPWSTCVVGGRSGGCASPVPPTT